LTCYSVSGGATESGEPRLYLKKATAKDLQDRLDVNAVQADALVAFGKTATNVLTDLLVTPLTGATGGKSTTPRSGAGGTGGDTSGNGSGNGGRQSKQPQQPQGGIPALNDKQLRAVLAECTMEDPVDRAPGKMNINTVSTDMLRDIVAYLGLDESIADEIIYMRESRPQGIVSLVDLKDIKNITPEDLRTVSRIFDTSSNVFTISSRGRSSASGVEVEIVAVVDRSTVPVRILEYREQ